MSPILRIGGMLINTELIFTVELEKEMYDDTRIRWYKLKVKPLNDTKYRKFIISHKVTVELGDDYRKAYNAPNSKGLADPLVKEKHDKYWEAVNNPEYHKELEEGAENLLEEFSRRMSVVRYSYSERDVRYDTYKNPTIKVNEFF